MEPPVVVVEGRYEENSYSKVSSVLIVQYVHYVQHFQYWNAVFRESPSDKSWVDFIVAPDACNARLLALMVQQKALSTLHR